MLKPQFIYGSRRLPGDVCPKPRDEAEADVPVFFRSLTEEPWLTHDARPRSLHENREITWQQANHPVEQSRLGRHEAVRRHAFGGHPPWKLERRGKVIPASQRRLETCCDGSYMECTVYAFRLEFHDHRESRLRSCVLVTWNASEGQLEMA